MSIPQPPRLGALTAYTNNKILEEYWSWFFHFLEKCLNHQAEESISVFSGATNIKIVIQSGTVAKGEIFPHHQFGHCPTASRTPCRLGSPICCLANGTSNIWLPIQDCWDKCDVKEQLQFCLYIVPITAIIWGFFSMEWFPHSFELLLWLPFRHFSHSFRKSSAFFRPV